MRITVFYFSGTGNTWWASEQLIGILQDSGVDASCHSIERVSDDEVRKLLSSSDIIGFGYPIYGSDLPAIMKAFMLALPRLERVIPTFVFCTQWMFSGDGARVASEFLDSTRFRIEWTEHVNMPNNVSVTALPLPYTNNPARLARILAKARAKLQRMARYILAGQPYRKGCSRWDIAMGSLQRVPFRRVFDRVRDDIDIDPERCIRCGRCVNICPAGNLTWSKGEVVADSSCIICLRCYSFCPTSAITYMGRRHKLSRGKPYQGPVSDFRPEQLLSEQKDGDRGRE